jgi:hypothetical protein
VVLSLEQLRDVPARAERLQLHGQLRHAAANLLHRLPTANRLLLDRL